MTPLLYCSKLISDSNQVVYRLLKGLISREKYFFLLLNWVRYNHHLVDSYLRRVFKSLRSNFACALPMPRAVGLVGMITSFSSPRRFELTIAKSMFCFD